MFIGGRFMSMTKEELKNKVMELSIKFYNIRYDKRTLKSYGYIGFTKKQALDSVNEEFKKVRDEYIKLM